MRRVNLPDEELIYEYANEEKSTVELSEKYGCSHNTINRHLIKCGVKLRSPYYYSINRRYKAKTQSLGKHPSDEARRKNREAHIGIKITRSKEYCRKMAESRRGSNNPAWGIKWNQSDEVRQKMSTTRRGENNPMWRGGFHRRDYCFKFNNRFKEQIREKFYRACYLCKIDEDQNKRKLAVHHIDYNKNSICNGKEWAFVPLCQTCHCATSANRWQWFNLLINYWAMNPDINFTLGDHCYGIYQVSRFVGCK